MTMECEERSKHRGSTDKDTDRETDRETEYSVLCLGYGDTDIYITNILNKK